MATQYRHVLYLIELQEKSSEDFLNEHVSIIFPNHQPAFPLNFPNYTPIWHLLLLF